MIARIHWALGASAILALAACYSPRTTLAPAPADMALSPLTAEAGAGGIAVTVRWPARQQVQAIPDETIRIVLRALKGGSVAKQVSLTRIPGETTSSASLKPLAFGSYVLAADAYDAQDVVMASGSAAVAIAANELVRPNLTLSLVDRPVLASMSMVSGIPGESVILRGTGFGASRSRPYKVTVGSVEATAVRSDDTYISMVVPLAATNSLIVLTVGTGAAQSTASFFTIKSLTLSTTSISVTHPGTYACSAVARDFNNSVISNPVVPWSLEDPTCTGNCLSAPALGTISSTGTYTTNGELGMVVVRAGRANSISATGSITVN